MQHYNQIKRIPSRCNSGWGVQNRREEPIGIRSVINSNQSSNDMTGKESSRDSEDDLKIQQDNVLNKQFGHTG